MYAVFRQIFMKPVWLRPLPRVLINHQTRILTQLPENIKLPPTPKPCCLAGCTNCVWVEYAHKLADLFHGYDEKAQEIVLNKVPDPVLRSFLKVELKSIQQQRAREHFDD
ncbi:oxidoreductase-like domain-containing protein 1 isoform X2 [Zeugodacus cucurbitae]|uniref:oxidoreductase-like domain-containing protein 1 isoform X2 n=1 Tax=Zeugodacus cucurbitae TaxID=28588 RepID=UPI0023D9173F|nr:oxidoreductase-like domain-containing protein 1 isoform X2 [Zeugodacus cucurbitae]